MTLSRTQDEILGDYRLAYRSRQASLIGRREVLTGKAKFGIFGDGKEVPQLAMAKVFREGDIRSGYYRDQTFMFATGMSTIADFFGQLYANPDLEHDPASCGRQMNAHFATRMIDDEGRFRDLAHQRHSSADTSPTSSQMPRLVGLAYASRLYRELDELSHLARFSTGGNEIAFGTIGNASCAEGTFWESINAIGVLQAPAIISIWDDEFGISVPNELQLAKDNLSALLEGFRCREGDDQGFDLYTARGWDYTELCQVYAAAEQRTREQHRPALIHVVEVTQPQGHSTSGSHERYKSPQRLAWEEEHDCLRRMRQWILAEGYATDEQLGAWEKEDLAAVREIQHRAWEAFTEPIRHELETLKGLFKELAGQSRRAKEIARITQSLERMPTLLRRHLMAASHQVLLAVRDEDSEARRRLAEWRTEYDRRYQRRYSSHLYSESPRSALEVPVVEPQWDEEAPKVNGFELLNRCFDSALGRHPELIAFGEDVGKLGDVNQGFHGLQEKYGKLRVSDTGIRECTILGQAIGMAMRGLRPLAEIQYLDYLLYALQILSDDLATLRFRSFGGQMAPVIIRTRGHRLEGIWHSGSPMSGILGLVRGVYVCVPRNMTETAGLYNTLLRSDDSAIVVEVLNAYRGKEKLPSNVERFTVPLGVPEVLRSGTDVTLVTYGACCPIALEAAAQLAYVGIETEVIDVRTLLPFDRAGVIGESLRRTNRLVCLDEDVPGGCTAYMLQEILEKQRGFHWLDAEPRTLPARQHRPVYGSDGDYWSKPNVEQIFDTIYELMHEAEPRRFPIFYR